MSKDKHFIGQPIFEQLSNFADKRDIRRLAKSQQADRYIKKLDGLTHFITMLYAVIGGFDSLREVVISLLSNTTKLSHLSINYSAKRSTLADANKRRASSFFDSIYTLHTICLRFIRQPLEQSRHEASVHNGFHNHNLV